THRPALVSSGAPTEGPSGGPLGARDLRRFVAEGRMLANLNHPTVVHIYRLGTYEGSPYIVMEFVKGQKLRTLLDQGEPTVPQLLGIMRQVAAGMGAIHSMGILHRDLTPSNIMVVDGVTAKILDLGLAKQVGTNTSMELS